MMKQLLKNCVKLLKDLKSQSCAVIIKTPGKPIMKRSQLQNEYFKGKAAQNKTNL